MRRRRSPFREPPEYQEEIYLSLDGTATVNVNASVASLVALRGVNWTSIRGGAWTVPRCAATSKVPVCG